MAITETWLRTKGDEASIAEFTPTNYAFIHLPRPITSKTVRGGGVGLMYRNDLFRILKMALMCDIKTLELFRIQMTSLSGRRFCIYIVYHPPSGTKLSGTETDFYSDLDILYTEASISTLPVIILGDFNIHYNNVHKSIKLRQLLDSFDMNQHVAGATHKQGNILDLVITPIHDNLDKIGYSM